MTREDAIRLFDGSAPRLAAAIGVVRSRIYQFPAGQPLPQPIADRVMGAALREGLLRYRGGSVVRPVDLLS